MPKQTSLLQAPPRYVRCTVSNLPCSNHFEHQTQDCGTASQLVQAGSAPSKSLELHCHRLIEVLAQYPAFSSSSRQVVDVFTCCRCPYFLPSVLSAFHLPAATMLQLSLALSATRTHIEGIVSYTLQGVESTKSWVRKIKLLHCSNQRQAVLHHRNTACAMVHFNWIPEHRNICQLLTLNYIHIQYLRFSYYSNIKLSPCTFGTLISRDDILLHRICLHLCGNLAATADVQEGSGNLGKS